MLHLISLPSCLVTLVAPPYSTDLHDLRPVPLLAPALLSQAGSVCATRMRTAVACLHALLLSHSALHVLHFQIDGAKSSSLLVRCQLFFYVICNFLHVLVLEPANLRYVGRLQKPMPVF